MELKIVEDSKNKLVFEIKGVSHGFCMMLKEQLLGDDHVKVATYRVEHPLVNIPRFLVETDGAEPRSVVLSAIKKLKTFAEKVQKDFKEELK
jgi:DNA-directed RNA polymerase subunit L